MTQPVASATLPPRSRFRTAEEVVRAYTDLCSKFGEVESVELVCHPSNRNEVTCLVNLRDNVERAVAATPGALVFGGAFCIAVAVTDDFTCRCRETRVFFPD